MKLMKAAAAILIGTIVFPSQASAWKLETHPKGYILTCADGKQWGFENYPKESSLKTACANHGGIISVEPTVSPRLQYMKNQELNMSIIEVEPAGDPVANDSLTNVPVRRLMSPPKPIEAVPPRN